MLQMQKNVSLTNEVRGLLALVPIFEKIKKFDSEMEMEEVDVDRFQLSKYTHDNFDNLAKLLIYKKRNEEFYKEKVQSKDKVLKQEKFKSFKTPSFG